MSAKSLSSCVWIRNKVAAAVSYRHWFDYVIIGTRTLWFLLGVHYLLSRSGVELSGGGTTPSKKQAEACLTRPAQFTKAQGDREIKVSMKYLRLKNQARQKLRSEEGYALAVRRMIEPEPVFGDTKNNRGFKRFLLRGLPKVSLEVGWLSPAHNLLKKAAVDAKNQGTKRESTA